MENQNKSTLNGRENMQMVWDHKQPERVPIITLDAQMLITPEINDRPLFQSGKDWFGVEWEIDPNHPELMTHAVTGKPLFTDITKWKDAISFPDIGALPWEMIEARTKAMWAKKDELMGYYVGNMGAFEKATSMMDFENALMSMIDAPEAFAEYVDAYADYRIEIMRYLKKHMSPDFLMMHDDWGTQQNLFFSADLWRQIFKEPERKMVEACRNLDMHYMHHSCGFIEPIVGDLVEIGVESWHSVSPANDGKKMKELYGDKLIFAGAVDPQVTDRPGATEDEIRAEVRRCIDTFGKGGGYMCSSAVMFSTMPGVDALIEDEALKYGRY